MSALIGSTEAARLLGVTKPTLYAYVSRGLVARHVAVDGRTSLYERDDVEQLAQRSRRGPAPERPSIDVRIDTGITILRDDSPVFRGHRALDLVEHATFEQVVELLLVGSMPDGAVRLRPHRPTLDRAMRLLAAGGPTGAITRIAIVAATLDDDDLDIDAAARRLIGISSGLLGGRANGDVATRLASAWVRRPTPELIRAISTALILLADHELATSTLAVRVAASVRTPPGAAIATGLHVVNGPLHGVASRAAAELFVDASESGARTAVLRRLDAGERLPGFGHTVYRNGDPRFAPLLAVVRSIPGSDRMAVVDDVIAEAGRAIGHLPNVDLALGALYVVAGLPVDAPLFAIARIAGWAAHYAEELGERPVRFRGLAAPR